ncbi:MAG: glycerophosphodiester phosphodiesterase [Clostridiales bacterium]|nr:glycerophosphodiester phosphodiesterase [Clostridiales bacterium]
METKTSWVLQKPIAHRGLHDLNIPENSLPAFENAVNHGFAIELDIRLTGENDIVVFHDEKLSRMTKHDGYVSNITSSDLENIKLLKTEFGIPTLEQVLETVNGKVPLLIEIKKSDNSLTLEEKLIDMLKTYNGEYAVEAFNPFSLQYFYKTAPNVMRGQLSSYFHHADIDASHREKKRLKKLKYNDISHPDFIAYKITNLPNKYVKNTGLPVVAWTIKSEIQAQKAATLCDNYIFEGFIPKINEAEPEIQ